QWTTAGDVAVLVSTHSSIALFAVLLVPSIYYLAVPVPFSWAVTGGAGCSLLLLVAYLGIPSSWDPAVGLTLAVVALNAALVLALIQSN
ncbi:hypothetical protein NL364_28965, partial [Klebsiella pneumoniae]|nr:hypothetical protein [Klebsiella pneumoniae]